MPVWLTLILIIIFFVGIWIVFLYIFSHMSKSHSWVLPVFAMGLGAPRWAQILWSTSNMGQYLPWTVGPIASGVAGRSLWLWLGVLDAVQGVGKSLSRLSLTYHRVHQSLLHPHYLADTSTHHVRLRHDTPPNPDPFPRPLHADRGANARLPRNNRRASHGAR